MSYGQDSHTPSDKDPHAEADQRADTRALLVLFTTLMAVALLLAGGFDGAFDLGEWHRFG